MKTTTELNDLLRDADPVPREPGLPAETLGEMRRTVIAAVARDARRSPPTPRIFAIAAAAALAAVVTAVIVRRPDAVRVPPTPRPAHGAAEPSSRTQMYFSTPGGTRVIWTFDPAFRLKEGRR